METRREDLICVKERKQKKHETECNIRALNLA